MFGFYHGNIVQFIYATALGLVLGYVYSKSRKIQFTIIIHMLINLCSGVLITWVMQETNIVSLLNEVTALGEDSDGIMALVTEHFGQFVGYFGYMAIYGGIVIAGIVLLIITLVKHIRRGQMILPGAESLVKGKRFATVVGNPGMILFLVLWGGMMVLNILNTYILPRLMEMIN